MDSVTTDCAALGETVVFLSYFNDLRGPRQQGKVTCPLDQILLWCLLAVPAGADGFIEIALFGSRSLSLFAASGRSRMTRLRMITSGIS